MTAGRIVAAGIVVVAAVVGGTARAQMPGQPVLQNAFSSPGVTVAANYGTGDSVRGYAGAASWAPPNGRFQVSAGLGAVEPEGEDLVLSWGARVMAPLPLLRPEGSLAVAAFAGAGGASPDGSTVLFAPVGVAAGYRRALGATRGLSIYVAPFYGWSRASADEATSSSGVVRVSLGIDLAISQSLGVSAGYETGATAEDGNPGSSGDVFGVGVSYVLRR
ncbi:MAG: hypothetical protein M3373_02345 [Gemmatimonadota bacterium]|nr:hypothetical protein [Gemmatimonadota bacterium]